MQPLPPATRAFRGATNPAGGEPRNRSPPSRISPSSCRACSPPRPKLPNRNEPVRGVARQRELGLPQWRPPPGSFQRRLAVRPMRTSVARAPSLRVHCAPSIGQILSPDEDKVEGSLPSTMLAPYRLSQPRPARSASLAADRRRNAGPSRIPGATPKVRSSEEAEAVHDKENRREGKPAQLWAWRQPKTPDPVAPAIRNKPLMTFPCRPRPDCILPHDGVPLAGSSMGLIANQLGYRSYEPLHFTLRRVARAPRPDQSRLQHTQPFQHRRRIEVSVTHEHAPLGQPP